MKFTEKNLAFLKEHNIEPTEENLNKLAECCMKVAKNKLSDDALAAVSGGTGYEGAEGAFDDYQCDWDTIVLEFADEEKGKARAALLA